MRRILIAGTIIFLLTSRALGWSDAGHKIIASIAFARLSEAERDKVIEILREHPRFKVDFLDELPTEVEKGSGDSREWMFQQASIWPDMTRGFKGADRQYNHSSWHYVNFMTCLSKADLEALKDKAKVNLAVEPPDTPQENINIIQALRLARKMLVDPKVEKPDKAIMLAWLFHLAGDGHQPLHATAFFSRKTFPEGDRGGNLIPTKQRGNLHALWDNFLGGKATQREAHKDALKMLEDPELARAGNDGAANLNEEEWLTESWDLAAQEAYGPILGIIAAAEKEGQKLTPISLDEGYLQASGKLCRRQAVVAGYRVAAGGALQYKGHETAIMYHQSRTRPMHVRKVAASVFLARRFVKAFEMLLGRDIHVKACGRWVCRDDGEFVLRTFAHENTVTGLNVHRKGVFCEAVIDGEPMVIRPDESEENPGYLMVSADI